MPRVTLRIDEDVLCTIKRMSDEEGITVSEFCRLSIEDRMEGRKSEEEDIERMARLAATAMRRSMKMLSSTTKGMDVNA